MNYQDYGHFRRKYPRRAFKRGAGILYRGQFLISECIEIGEGGLSFSCGRELTPNTLIVASFRIPNGDFVSLRAEVRAARPSPQGGFIHGVAFTHIAFTHKRQIRSFVSERTERESVGM
ncbi:MAG: PilZ domain-containing protein [Bdellovibrionaceae bacterium]|nr:PilZ domain-containing protein [Pseudobdellovibrionaceae bacterium]